MSERDEHIEKMKSQLDSGNAELAKWEAKSMEAETELRPEYEK